jgi:hypothetical protein
VAGAYFVGIARGKVSKIILLVEDNPDDEF